MKLPKNIIHPKGAELSVEDAQFNENLLLATDEMDAEINRSVLPRLKSEYGITSADDDHDDVDLVWVCGGLLSLSWNFDFGLKKEDFKKESDYDFAIADKWEQYFHKSEEQAIVNMIGDSLMDGWLFD